MISQIICFTLRSPLTISAPAFLQLRRDVAQAGALSQYFGYSTQTRVAPLSKKRHEVSWVIQWCDGPGLVQYTPLLAALNELSNDDLEHLTIYLKEDTLEGLTTALNAPVCEVVSMKLKQDSPMTDSDFIISTHKTYTDCYKTPGFTGGNWGYATNTNETKGGPLTLKHDDMSSEKRRLAIYFLGWESSELHEDYNKTPLFAEEMIKLGPWVENTSGAWYVSLQKHE